MDKIEAKKEEAQKTTASEADALKMLSKMTEVSEGAEDVPLENHTNLRKDIIRVVDGTMVVSVVDMLSST